MADPLTHLITALSDRYRIERELGAATGALRPVAELPAACDVFSVSFAAAVRRATCVVQDRRADVALIDELRP